MSSGSLKPVRRSVRLKEFDYSGAGAYCITLCTIDRKCLFGKIVNGEMALNALGKAVAETWEWLGRQYAYLTLDAFVIMPNHIHGIIFITSDCTGGSRTAPTSNRKPLGRLVGAFKTVSTKKINKIHGPSDGRMWQRNYYEHVIRTGAELDEIRQYIINNPYNGNWTAKIRRLCYPSTRSHGNYEMSMALTFPRNDHHPSHAAA